MVLPLHGEAAGPQLGKFFDMVGYDTMALVQSVTDDYVRFVVMHNQSTHVLLAEVHAASEPSDGMADPGKLLATYRYDDANDWRVAYRLALAEAVRRAGIGGAPADPEACPGCNCKPGDGVTEGCSHPDGCGYFKTEVDSADISRLSKIAREADPRD